MNTARRMKSTCVGFQEAHSWLPLCRHLRRFRGRSTAGSSICWQVWRGAGLQSPWGSLGRGAGTTSPTATSEHFVMHVWLISGIQGTLELKAICAVPAQDRCLCWHMCVQSMVWPPVLPVDRYHCAAPRPSCKLPDDTSRKSASSGWYLWSGLMQGGFLKRVDNEGAGLQGRHNKLHQGGLLPVPAALPALQPAHL